MKKIWFFQLVFCCLLSLPALSQLYNNGATITITNGTTVAVNSGDANTIGLDNQGIVQNSGKLVLGIVSELGEIGIENSGVINNNACAEISVFAPIINSSTFINNGLFRVNTVDEHTNSGLQNNGIINYIQSNLIPNVTNIEIIIAPTTSNECLAISPAFILDNPVDVSILGIYEDESAMISAGTYDAATNTFTPTLPLEEGIYDLYVEVEDGDNCISIVPWQLTTEDCCDAPVALCQDFTATLDGSTVTITPQEVNNGSTADCGLQSLVVSPNSFDCSHVVDPQVVILSVTDIRGKVSSCSAIVTVQDNTAPTVQCFNQSISFNGEMITILEPVDLVEVDDNCGVQSITLSPNTITSDQVGQTVPVLVTVTDPSSNTATCISQVSVSGLPAGWSQNPNGIGCDDGNSINYSSGSDTWTATSSSCYYSSPYTSDESAFAQYSLCGDGSITAQVTDISGTSFGWAGVAMRETNAPGAKKAQLTTNLSNFGRREFRLSTDGSAFPQQFPIQNRRWLRIVRSGNQFVMYTSVNGLSWTFAGAQNIQMNSCIEIGLVVSNYSSNSTVTATFANVSVTGGNSQPLSDDGVTALVNMDSQQDLQDVKVYPNPTSGQLNIALTGYAGRPVTLEVYNTVGQIVYTKKVDEGQNADEIIDLSAAASGMYLIRVSSDGLPAEMKRVTVAR